MKKKNAPFLALLISLVFVALSGLYAIARPTGVSFFDVIDVNSCRGCGGPGGGWVLNPVTSTAQGVDTTGPSPGNVNLQILNAAQPIDGNGFECDSYSEGLAAPHALSSGFECLDTKNTAAGGWTSGIELDTTPQRFAFLEINGVNVFFDGAGHTADNYHFKTDTTLCNGKVLGFTDAIGTIACVPPSTGGLVNYTLRVITASGVYTPTAGTKFVDITCVGGGAAGGSTVGAVGQINSGAGGGSGSQSRVRLTAAQITADGGSETVTIGAAGTPGAAGTNPGNNGGDTSVGSRCVGKGGTGGPGGAALTQAAGGVGGVSGTGDFTPTGNDGQQNIASSSIAAVMPFPFGGLGPFGGATHNAKITGNACFANGAATGYGTGGDGGLCYNTASSGQGSPGAPGEVTIAEWQ